MNLTIEIPDMLEAALETKAHERGLSGSGYASQVLERDLRPDEPEKNPNELPIGKLFQTL